MNIIFMLLLTNGLVMLVTAIVLGCMLLIILKVFHPENKSIYESHAIIPLEDESEGEEPYHLPAQDRFSMFI